MAGTDANISWIALHEVPDLVAKDYLSATYLEIWTREQLIPALIAGRVRWKALASGPAGELRDDFFQRTATDIELNWKENVARLFVDSEYGIVGSTHLFAVKLCREDIEALLPAAAVAIQPPTPAQTP